MKNIIWLLGIMLGKENLGPAAELGSNGDIIPETLVGWSGPVSFEVPWRRRYHSGVRPFNQNWSGFFSPTA